MINSQLLKTQFLVFSPLHNIHPLFQEETPTPQITYKVVSVPFVWTCPSIFNFLTNMSVQDVCPPSRTLCSPVYPPRSPLVKVGTSSPQFFLSLLITRSRKWPLMCSLSILPQNTYVKLQWSGVSLTPFSLNTDPDRKRVIW